MAVAAEDVKTGQANEEAGKDLPEDNVEEAAAVPKLRGPAEPTKEEIEEHMISHMPYRSWCPHCVRGRGRNLAHRQRDKDEDPTVPTLSADYAFMGKDDNKAMPVLAQRDSRSLYSRLDAVTCKGPDCPHAVNCMRAFIYRCGYKHFT